MASPTPGNANPGNVKVAPLGARAREQALAERLGQTYTPGQAAGTAQNAYDQQQLHNIVAKNYAGASQAIASQIAAAQDRYGKNQADIRSILGTLTSIRAEDKAKINDQFTSAIQASQDRANAMNAQAQQQLAAGQQGAQIAGAELGGGPQGTPTDSLTSQAVAQGVADQNANQGVWNNLMQGMNMQQQGNVNTAVNGYDLQKAGALEALRKNYEDAMLGLGNQNLSLQDQIAQGVSGIQAAQASAANDINLQKVKNIAPIEAARLRAQATMYNKSKSGGTPTTSATKYTKDAIGFAQRAKDAGLSFDDISASVTGAFTKVRDVNNAAAASGASAQKPTKAAVLAAWKSMNKYAKNPDGTRSKTIDPTFSLYLPYVEQYINMNY